MPLLFMYKVQHLCRRINEVEWSGIVWYRVNGTISNPQSCTIVVEDILLMDIGNKTYTEYEFGMDVVSYMMANTVLKDMRYGHIHSHNTMKTFFSGTDNDELNENSAFHNMYFSLIVNNVTDCTARVAFRGKTPSSNIIAKNEKGKEYVIRNATPVSESLFIYECDINYPHTGKLPEVFTNRVTEVVKEYNAKLQKVKDKQVVNNVLNNSNKTLSPYLPREVGNGFNGNYNNGNFSSQIIVTEFDAETEVDLPDEIYYDFTTYLLRLGNLVTDSTGKDSLGDAIEDIIISQTESTIPSLILKDFIELHSKFFDLESNTLEYVLFTLSNVILILEEDEETYPWLTNLICGLRSFAVHLQKQ